MANNHGQIFEGNLVGEGLKFAVVVSRFNEFITSKLLSGALDAFVRHGAKPEDVDVAWTPGTFEMPLVARRLADSGKYDAVCCVGAVMRGGTPHFEYVAGECVSGLSKVMMEAGIPVAFGVLTVDTIEQAIERSGCKAGYKGEEAALSALEMVSLLDNL